MIKKPSELSEQEKTIIHWSIFIVILLFAAYYIYIGFSQNLWWKENYCIVDQNNNVTCFNSSYDRDSYMDENNYPKNIDYKYINEYTNISLLNNSS